MAIAWIPLCFLALAAQRLFGIRHTMYSVFSLVHFWDLSQGLLGLVFLSSEHFLCTSPKNQIGSRRNSSRRAWVAHGIGAKKYCCDTIISFCDKQIPVAYKWLLVAQELMFVAQESIFVAQKLMPVAVNGVEKPKPGSEGTITSNESFGSPPKAAGSVKGATTFSQSQNVQGHPCVNMRGVGLGPFPFS